MSDNDKLLDALNEAHGRDRGIKFCAATDAVVLGLELEDSGNKQYGKNVFVATGPRFVPNDEERITGQTISVGSEEKFKHCRLSCTKRGKNIVVAVYEPGRRRISRELTCEHQGADSVDEGQLAWFGPVEDICTPWSDNDPAQCQVITVDRLRTFAESYNPKKKKSK
jgi:hypothetical protein